jgi:Family of unknown function (DUF5947)
MSLSDPVEIGAEIQLLIGRISASPSSVAVDAQRLVDLLMTMHGTGLSRIIELVHAEPGHRVLYEQMRRDPLVGSLLALHDVASPPPELIQITRARPQHPGDDGRAASPQRCELCQAPLTSHHAHVLDCETRRLLCACRTCSEVGGRYQLVPSRYLHGPSMRLTKSQWDTLGIPVGLAFFVFDSQRGHVIASYPGPAGATESVLPLDAWPALDASWLRELAPDVEALLVRRRGDEYLCYVVPLDACYELVGRIRQTWTGLGGGTAARAEVDKFFEDIDQRASRPVELQA